MQHSKHKIQSILSAIAMVVLLSVVNIHADYRSDQDLQRDAQKLKDADDADRAAQKREYDSEQPHGGGDGLGTFLCIGPFILVFGLMIYGALNKKK